MSDTPRTDLKAVVPLDIHSCPEFCRRIERELNIANFDNEKLIEANRFYAMDKSELEHKLAAVDANYESAAAVTGNMMRVYAEMRDDLAAARAAEGQANDAYLALRELVKLIAQ